MPERGPVHAVRQWRWMLPDCICILPDTFAHLDHAPTVGIANVIQTTLQLHYCSFITPPPIGGRGIVFERFLSFFLCLLVSLSATLRENGWTDLHEIFREGVEWPWDDLIQFWVNSGTRVGGSKVKFFVITSHSSESHCHSLGGSGGLAACHATGVWQVQKQCPHVQITLVFRHLYLPR